MLGTVLYTNTRTLDTIAVVALVVEYHVCCSHPCWTPVGNCLTLVGHVVGYQPTLFGHLVGDQPTLFGHLVGK